MKKSRLNVFTLILFLEIIAIDKAYSFFLLGVKIRPASKFIRALDQEQPDLDFFVIGHHWLWQPSLPESLPSTPIPHPIYSSAQNCSMVPSTNELSNVSAFVHAVPSP